LKGEMGMDSITVDVGLIHICTPCLLCGETIDLGPCGYGYSNKVPRICDDCKELWKKLKEANKNA
jgi:hypothetical protein